MKEPSAVLEWDVVVPEYRLQHLAEQIGFRWRELISLFDVAKQEVIVSGIETSCCGYFLVPRNAGIKGFHVRGAVRWARNSSMDLSIPPTAAVMGRPAKVPVSGLFFLVYLGQEVDTGHLGFFGQQAVCLAGRDVAVVLQRGGNVRLEGGESRVGFLGLFFGEFPVNRSVVVLKRPLSGISPFFSKPLYLPCRPSVRQAAKVRLETFARIRACGWGEIEEIQLLKIALNLMYSGGCHCDLMTRESKLDFGEELLCRTQWRRRFMLLLNLYMFNNKYRFLLAYL